MAKGTKRGQPVLPRARKSSDGEIQEKFQTED